MCGIFGVTITEPSRFTEQNLKRCVEDLFTLSESRGKEAAGLAILTPDAIHIHKEPISASRMIRSRPYRQMFAVALEDVSDGGGRQLGNPTTIIGHSRLVTNGAQEIHQNNQPVVGNGLIGIHNGIIVNDEQLWERFPSLQRQYQVDTEVLLSLVRHYLALGRSLIEAVQQTFAAIEGAASIAVVFEEFDYLLLATNNGSLYTCRSDTTGLHVFASERYILQMLAKRRRWRHLLDVDSIKHVRPGTGMLVNTVTLAVARFSLDPRSVPPQNGHRRSRPRHVVDDQEGAPASTVVRLPTAGDVPTPFRDHSARVSEAVANLRRCTRCILPETMPFIEFDDAGVCNYCRNYRKMEIRGEDALLELADRYRSQDGRPDCVVTFSGGRDSSFGLHYAKTVLRLNPISYTYDWGMVTDLARRNQARICGKLGIEHVLISADINRKRRNIRLNVTAWLKRPDLGTIPLFMAGDKQYFYYANKLREQTGCDLIVLCENMLETTGFKSGYCGIRPDFSAEHTYSLSLAAKFRLAAYYGRQYLLNPGYVNRSLLDSISAYCCYYFIPHDYLNLFNYVRWEEDRINQTLHDHYDWETATDTKSTWRIGDGTASFYNYIYYVVSGFSENDTFRSNQIREGMLTRDQALALVQDENQPRFESIQWYCDTIGVDFRSTIARINQVPTLYPLR